MSEAPWITSNVPNILISIVNRNTSIGKLDFMTFSKISDLLKMYRMGNKTDYDEIYMNDIIGYDGDFNIKVKAWMLKHMEDIKTKDQRMDYYAFRPDRVSFKHK